MSKNRQAGYGVFIAILAAGVLIAGAVFLSGNNGGAGSNTASGGNTATARAAFRMPDESDHIRGNPDAAVTIVEFSDLECPFCARLHPTLTRIVEENDDVRWVYRHFPLSSHSKAFGAAVAAECVAKFGGNEAFWDFADTAFGNQRRLGESFYKEFASAKGIAAAEFDSCLKDDTILSEVQTDLNEVINTGGRGTPFVVVIAASGKLTSFSGALPYEQISAVLDQARLR